MEGKKKQFQEINFKSLSCGIQEKRNLCQADEASYELQLNSGGLGILSLLPVETGGVITATRNCYFNAHTGM